jgi:hypothetical protein
MFFAKIMHMQNILIQAFFLSDMQWLFHQLWKFEMYTQHNFCVCENKICTIFAFSGTLNGVILRMRPE